MARYRTMSIREDVYNELVKLKDEKHFSSLSDTVAFLIAFYRDYGKKLQKLERSLRLLLQL